MTVKLLSQHGKVKIWILSDFSNFFVWFANFLAGSMAQTMAFMGQMRSFYTLVRLPFESAYDWSSNVVSNMSSGLSDVYNDLDSRSSRD